jgi:hypothetical protein
MLQPLPPGPGVARPCLSAGHTRSLPYRNHARHTRRRAPPAAVRAAQSRCVRASLRRRTPSHLSAPLLFHAVPHLGPPPRPCLPRLRFKRSRPAVALHRTLFSFSPSLSSVHDHVSVTCPFLFRASRPRHRPSHRGPWCIFDRCHRRPPPTVRPASLPPFRYLGPPSPLSSSLTAPGASRSRLPPSVSPASTLVPRRPPGGLHELTSNTLPPASHHRSVDDCATVSSHARGAHGDHTLARPVRAMAWARGPPPRLDQATRPWPSLPRRALHCSRGLDLARHCAAIFNRFQFI